MRSNREIVEAGFMAFLALGMLTFLLSMARPVPQSLRTKQLQEQ